MAESMVVMKAVLGLRMAAPRVGRKVVMLAVRMAPSMVY